MRSLKDAIRDWDAEVEAEAERLIKLGVAPYDAIIQARQRVAKKRRASPQTEPELPRS